jgi:pimeloyl-ACP methyl ester carboxylesterase
VAPAFLYQEAGTVPTPSPRKLHTHLRVSDLRGLVRLATRATEGVTGIVEGVHQSVRSTLGFPDGGQPGRTGGLTGAVYASIRGITQLVADSVDSGLSQLESLVDFADDSTIESPQREAVLAALNGVMGDRLLADENPFATRMSLRHRGVALNLEVLPSMPEATGRILVLVHGLCMNELQWRTHHETGVVDHGEAVAEALGYTPVSVRYNSGLHTSENGRELATVLEELVTRWPVAVEELTVLAHSMGGLLIRSAAHLARQQHLRWPDHLKNIVFLGTPHHGAPLEQAGNWVDVVLGSTPYTAPFAALGELRSAGITDLRFGHLLDEDWQSRDRFDHAPDTRRVVPLPEGVACYAVAATTAAKRGFMADRLIGDGLVPVASALGVHNDPSRDLGFPTSSQCIRYGTNHLGLLSSPEVTRQILQWLKPSAA